MPTIYWDYAYLGSPSEGVSDPEEERREEEKGSSPLLVAWDGVAKRYWAWILPAKGVDFTGLENVLHVIRGFFSVG